MRPGLASVGQLQALNEMIRKRLRAFPASRVMILGVAGGNGLEHISKGTFQKVYGVDVNAAYLEAAPPPPWAGGSSGMPAGGSDPGGRPAAGGGVGHRGFAEYIGYPCFQEVIRRVRPAYVSCVIQLNTEDGWVSDSPCLPVLGVPEGIHGQMEALERAMAKIGYGPVRKLERPLPNGKKLVRLDFARR